MKIKNDKNYKVGQIRFNSRHGHYGHIKAIIGTKDNIVIACVFLSSKKHDGKKENLPISVPLSINDVKHSYFITRIRSYPASTYSSMYIEDGLSEDDVRLSDTIYEMYLERKKIGTARSGNCANH